MIGKRKLFISIALVVVLLGASIAVFFVPKPAASTYQALIEMIEQEHRLGVGQAMLDLQSKGHGDNYESSFDGGQFSAIVNTRKKLFGNWAGERVVVGDYSFYSYWKLEDELNQYMQYYIASTKVASGAARSKQRQVEGAVADVKKALSKVNGKINDVLNLQKKTLDGDGIIAELTTAYSNLQHSYRALLTKKAELTLELKQFVIRYSFNNNFADVAYSAIGDCYVYSVRAAMSVSYQTENGYLLDSSTILEKLNNYRIEDIFTPHGLTEGEFVLSYRQLYDEYNSGLVNLFSLPHEIKSNVVNENNFTNSNIRLEYQTRVRDVLKVLGVT